MPSLFTLAWRGQCLGKTAFDFAVFAMDVAEVSWSLACVICSPLLLEGMDMESKKKLWVHSDFHVSVSLFITSVPSPEAEMSVLLTITGKRSDGSLSGSMKADASCVMVFAQHHWSEG